MKAAARSNQPPSSKRGIVVTRHAKPPTGARRVLLAALVPVLLAIAIPFFYQEGLGQLTAWLGRYGAAPLIGFGIVLFSIWAYVTDKGVRQSAWSLYLASLGLIVLMICVGLAVASMIASSPDWLAFRRFLPMVVPLASAAVVVGFAGYGLRVSRKAFSGEDKRVGYGLIILLLSLVGLAVAVRLARVDLPLPRLDQPLELQLW